jgi:hypothetical protein
MISIGIGLIAFAFVFGGAVAGLLFLRPICAGVGLGSSYTSFCGLLHPCRLTFTDRG